MDDGFTRNWANLELMMHHEWVKHWVLALHMQHQWTVSKQKKNVNFEDKMDRAKLV